ncbi:hypothetical protein [Loktanella sp. Alg231-35]|uniref:hypothetical protein n=1 Tax=Loktanella sp. Alg231-35 TaxID=1922220 RepID=UPI00131F27AA|nr:hypothetical protein [Loktanella sp. Alg231-35]
MLWRFWKNLKVLRDQRQATAWMLLRKDDRWLKDIGLTRHELRTLLNEWKE